MTPPRDPDEILAAWLDEGPSRLPDQTRRAIVVALPTTTQRRRGIVAPWRFDLMTQTTKVAIGLVAVAVIAVGGLYLLGPGSAPSVGGRTSPSPAASPSEAGPAESAPPTPEPSGSGLADEPTILAVTATDTGCTPGAGQLNKGPLSPGSVAWITVTNDSTKVVFFELGKAEDAAEFEEFRLYMQAEHERGTAGEPLLGPPAFIDRGASRTVQPGATDRFLGPTLIGVYGVACAPQADGIPVDAYLVGPLKVAP